MSEEDAWSQQGTSGNGRSRIDPAAGVEQATPSKHESAPASVNQDSRTSRGTGQLSSDQRPSSNYHDSADSREAQNLTMAGGQSKAQEPDAAETPEGRAPSAAAASTGDDAQAQTSEQDVCASESADPSAERESFDDRERKASKEDANMEGDRNQLIDDTSDHVTAPNDSGDDAKVMERKNSNGNELDSTAAKQTLPGDTSETALTDQTDPSAAGNPLDGPRTQESIDREADSAVSLESEEEAKSIGEASDVDSHTTSKTSLMISHRCTAREAKGSTLVWHFLL